MGLIISNFHGYTTPSLKKRRINVACDNCAAQGDRRSDLSRGFVVTTGNYVDKSEPLLGGLFFQRGASDTHGAQHLDAGFLQLPVNSLDSICGKKNLLLFPVIGGLISTCERLLAGRPGFSGALKFIRHTYPVPPVFRLTALWNKSDWPHC